MKVLNALIFVVLCFFSSSAFAQSAKEAEKRQELCAVCHLENTDRCEKGCDSISSSGATPQCIRGCISSSCVSSCGGYTRTPSGARGGRSNFDQFSGECGRCLRNQEYGQCSDSCSEKNSENPAVCRRTCAKALCSSSCQLPEQELERKSKKITKHDCGKCKQTSSSYCSERCGKNSERAGYTSCHVSCVQERCLDVCQPEPSDRSF